MIARTMVETVKTIFVILDEKQRYVYIIII